MKSFIAALRSLVLPFGRTSGQRIILNGDTGVIQIYDSSNNLIAELGPDTDGGGGMWTRGLQAPQNLAAFLGGGELRFEPVTNGLVFASAEVLYDTDGLTYADLLLSSGGVNVGNPRARLLLESTTAAGNANAYVTGDGANLCNLDVDGLMTAGNVRSGTAQTPAPGGVPAQTSVVVNFATAMQGTPRVTATPNSAAANLNTTNIRHAVTGVSTTGFTINAWRDSNFATNFDWVAVG